VDTNCAKVVAVRCSRKVNGESTLTIIGTHKVAHATELNVRRERGEANVTTTNQRRQDFLAWWNVIRLERLSEMWLQKTVSANFGHVVMQEMQNSSQACGTKGVNHENDC
jgi:hypothetical protein